MAYLLYITDKYNCFIYVENLLVLLLKVLLKMAKLLNMFFVQERIVSLLCSSPGIFSCPLIYYIYSVNFYIYSSESAPGKIKERLILKPLDF